MAELYMGEYGIFQEIATLDTIGVDPSFQGRRVGKKLLNKFMEHLKKIGAQKINTLVDWNDTKLILRPNESKPASGSPIPWRRQRPSYRCRHGGS